MEAAAVARGVTREILAFSLGAERYGVEILQVQEIRQYEKPTAVPNAPSFLLGIKAMRDTMVPIVDMRVRFNSRDKVPHPVIIVVRIRERLVGLVVDAVSDVIVLDPADVRPVPPMGGLIDAHFLAGMANREDGILTLVNLVELLSSSELDLLREVARPATAIA